MRLKERECGGSEERAEGVRGAGGTGKGAGKLFVVGIGPGATDLLTLRALNALKRSECVLGHRTYIEQVRHILNCEVFVSGMGREIERVRLAVSLARSGKTVSLVSGGDPSIYGMASLVAEYLWRHSLNLNYEVIPGVTALCSASPLLGSAVSGDHAVISLSDRLTPWSKIEQRLRHALRGDFNIVIYNPSSRMRAGNLRRALRIILEERGNVQIGVVKNASRENENFFIVSAEKLISSVESIDMHTLLFIPDSETFIFNGKMLSLRGYSRKYHL